MPAYTAADLIQLTKTVKSILLYGPSLSGKTTSLWTLLAYLKENSLGPLHLFDMDLKCESLVRAAEREKLLDWLVVIRVATPDPTSVTTKRIDADNERWQEFCRVFNVYQNMIDFATGKWREPTQSEKDLIQLKLAKGHPTPPTVYPGAVVIDSLTTIGDIVLGAVVAQSGHDLGAKGTDSRADYGAQMNKVMELIRSLKALPCITGWCAHDQLKQDGLEGRIVRLPLITGQKLPSALAKEFNCVIYSPRPIEVNGKPVYQWQVRGGGENRVESAGVTSRDDLPLYVEQDFRKIF